MTNLERYLNNFDEGEWLSAIESLLPEIHEVDRNAVQIWFRFFPLELFRYLQTAEDKEKAIELEGVVTAVLAGTMFRVKLRNGHQVLAHISGKMRKRFIRLVIGDGVKLEMSPYDPDKARIVYRL